MPPVTVLRADYDDPQHAAAIVALLDGYARDPMGGEKPLTDDVKARLVDGLKASPVSMVWLARDGDQFVGVVTAFAGYSTFAAKPRWNVHDVAVDAAGRGRGIGRALLERVIADAEQAGACAISLEVRHDNAPARHLYRSLGWGDDVSPMDFWVRKIG